MDRPGGRVLVIRKGVRELAPPRMLVWWVHEVYDSYHFPLPAAADDPICFRYVEGETSLRNVGKFSACLAKMIESHGEVLDRLHGPTPRRMGGGA